MSLRKNQLGALNPVLIVLLVLVVGAVGFAGYKVYDKNKKDSGSSGSAVELSKSEQKAINSECEKHYNDKDFCKFATNWGESKTYKASFTITDADGTVSTNVMEKDGENSSMVSSSDGVENSAFITLNKVSYMKDYEAGVWYKMPQAETPETDGLDDPAKELDFVAEDQDITTDKTTVKSLGKEACGDKTCFKYQIIDPSDTEIAETLVWFDDKDYKLARMTTKSTDGGSSDMTYTYPDSINITEPSPVQDFPSFDAGTLGQ